MLFSGMRTKIGFAVILSMVYILSSAYSANQPADLQQDKVVVRDFPSYVHHRFPNSSTVDEKGRFTTRASYYGYNFAGRKTASGRRFDPNGFSAAHPKLPFGTKILVENPRNGKSCTVVVEDRGPWRGGRGLDLSLGAARRIGLVGVAPVVCYINPTGVISQESGRNLTYSVVAHESKAQSTIFDLPAQASEENCKLKPSSQTHAMKTTRHGTKRTVAVWMGAERRMVSSRR